MKGQHQRKCFKKIHCFFLLLLDILQIVSNVCTYFYNGGGEISLYSGWHGGGRTENKPEGVGVRIGLYKAKVCLNFHLRTQVYS